jgi:cell division septum initiation protein DivIVA
MQTDFRTAFFGYSKKQVEEFLSRMSHEHEDAMALKNERFVEMRDQNNIMKAELADYKRKEQEISATLIKAQTVATEIIHEGEQGAVNERARLTEEIRQLDQVAQSVYSRLENALLMAADCVHGFEQDLNELITRKEAFLRATYGFDRQGKDKGEEWKIKV